MNEDINCGVEQENWRIKEIAVVYKHILHNNFGRWKYSQIYSILKAWVSQHPVLYAH